MAGVREVCGFARGDSAGTPGERDPVPLVLALSYVERASAGRRFVADGETRVRGRCPSVCGAHDRPRHDARQRPPAHRRAPLPAPDAGGLGALGIPGGARLGCGCGPRRQLLLRAADAQLHGPGARERGRPLDLPRGGGRRWLHALGPAPPGAGRGGAADGERHAPRAVASSRRGLVASAGARTALRRGHRNHAGAQLRRPPRRRALARGGFQPRRRRREQGGPGPGRRRAAHWRSGVSRPAPARPGVPASAGWPPGRDGPACAVWPGNAERRRALRARAAAPSGRRRRPSPPRRVRQ